jgi:hypothetical protein
MAAGEGDVDSPQHEVEVLPISALEVDEVDSAFVGPAVSVLSSLFGFYFEFLPITKILNISFLRRKVHKSLTMFYRN